MKANISEVIKNIETETGVSIGEGESYQEYLHRVSDSCGIDDEKKAELITEFQEAIYSPHDVDISERKVREFLSAASPVGENGSQKHTPSEEDSSSITEWDKDSGGKGFSTDQERPDPNISSWGASEDLSKTRSSEKVPISLPSAFQTRIPAKLSRNPIAGGVLIGSIATLLEHNVLFTEGFPYGGDAFSNLIPALYFRAAIRTGGDPFMTPWYGGMHLLNNGFFKGFYPAWTPLFIPGIPIDVWLKIILIGHFFFASLVAYWYAHQHFEVVYAFLLAALFVLPMTYFNAHLSKTIAWPWVILGTLQLYNLRVGSDSRRTGLLLGVSGGMVLLTANIYYAFYLGVLAGCVLITTRSVDVATYAGIGSLVGLPKLISVIPVMLRGGRETPVGYELTFPEFINGLTGLWYDGGLLIGHILDFGAYAVIGPGACLLAAYTVIWGMVEPERFPKPWLFGVVVAGIIGGLLATASPIAYSIPLVDTFRTANRAVIMIALVALLLVAELLTQLRDMGPRIWGFHGIKPKIQASVAGLLLLSAVVAGTSPIDQPHNSNVEPTTGREVAQELDSAGCEPVWLEIVHDGKKAPYRKQISFALAERGISATAISYAKIGQEYSTHGPDGELTFEAIILPAGTQLPNQGRVKLTGGWGHPVRGSIDVTRFKKFRTISTPHGPIRLYAVDGRCS